MSHLPIFNKWPLKLQKYDYTIIYKPGKEMVFGRHAQQVPFKKENLPIELHQNIQHVNFTPDRINIRRSATERHPIYSTVHHMILSGWSKHIHKVPHIAHHFLGTRDEKLIENGLLL